MSRSLLLVLALVLGTVLANALLPENGYVAISFRGYLVEMSVPTLVLCVLLTLLALHGIQKLVRLPARLRATRLAKRQSRAREDLNRGLLEMAAGRWADAEVTLARAARDGVLPAVHYFALKPATSRQAEVGIKSNLGGVLINAALFRTRTADEIVTLTNAGGRATFQNAGSTSRDGVEISVSSRLPAGFSIAAAVTAVDARYRDSFLTCVAAPCATPTVRVASGNQMPGVPRESLYAELVWRLPSAGFSTALEGRRVARVYVDDRNTDSADTYTVFNLRAGFEQRAGAWTVNEFLRIDNLGDQRYVGSVIVNESNARFFEPSPGRNWLVGASASYRFK